MVRNLKKSKITILAIESSCDDTSAAIVVDGVVLSNIMISQEIHELYGGVIPEVASRQHQQNILPVVDTALSKAGVTLKELDAIAFTKGPGLLGSLIVGVSFAKALALSLDIPLIDVHHMHAHVLAHFATDKKPEFPFLCLTVSGGHTQIIHVKSISEMSILGQTIDDAAGEAFDKAGKMMGLPYPAGPHIDRLAKLGTVEFSFPQPNVSGLDFSFSGLKTSFLYFLQKNMAQNNQFIQENLENLCASIQHTIVKILISKLHDAINITEIKNIALAGGVSANSELRSSFLALANQENVEAFIPPFEYCTDNAAMIGITGYYKFLDQEFADHSVSPEPRLAF